MKCINAKEHRWIYEYHRRRCTRCGLTRPHESCGRRIMLPEPAGESSLLCGHFEHREQCNAKRLWDELRLSLAYQPFGDEALTQPYPPRWFLDQLRVKEEAADA